MLNPTDSNIKPRQALPRGTYVRIAGRHRVSRQFVRMVDLGLKKSRRISATLAKYRAKLAQQEALDDVA